MKINKLIFTFLFALCSLISFAQFDFSADTLTGCGILNVTFTLDFTVGVSSAYWDFGNGTTNTNINPPVVTYNSTGRYTVYLIVNNTDTITKYNYITLAESPVSDFSFSSDSTPGTFDFFFICDDQTDLSLTYTYTWDFGDNSGLLSSGTNIAYHKYHEDGSFTTELSVENNLGCLSQSTEIVQVYDSLEVPNIFTPNDDNHNDKLIIKTNGYSAYLFHVYNRTGTLIFKTESPVIIWDGKTNAGIKVSTGVYFYVLKEVNGTDEKVGFFYLYRE